MANDNHSLRTVVATTLDVIHSDNGYIAPTRNATTNTISKVLATIKRTPTPTLEPEYWQFADEMIGFFRILESNPDYKKILELPDGPMYKTAMDIAKSDEITLLNFPYAVAMPTLYSKLKPQKPKPLNPLKSEAKIIRAGEFMGVINEEGRFFVKLVKVGEHNATKGGTQFCVTDRSGNVGFFYDTISKWEGQVYLGDCFAVHATPHSHTTADNTEKQTTFRTVKFLKDTIIQGKVNVDPANDSTKGKFTR